METIHGMSAQNVEEKYKCSNSGRLFTKRYLNPGKRLGMLAVVTDFIKVNQLLSSATKDNSIE